MRDRLKSRTVVKSFEMLCYFNLCMYTCRHFTRISKTRNASRWWSRKCLSEMRKGKVCLRYSKAHSKPSSPWHRRACHAAWCCRSCRQSSPHGRPGPWLCSRCLHQPHSPHSWHSVLSVEQKRRSWAHHTSISSQKLLLCATAVASHFWKHWRRSRLLLTENAQSGKR